MSIFDLAWLEIRSVATVGSAAALALCSCATLDKTPSGQEGRRSAHASSRPQTRLGVRQNTVQRVCNTPLLLLVCKREGIEERLLGSGLAQRGPAVSSLQLWSTHSPHVMANLRKCRQTCTALQILLSTSRYSPQQWKPVGSWNRMRNVSKHIPVDYKISGLI